MKKSSRNHTVAKKQVAAKKAVLKKSVAKKKATVTALQPGKKKTARKAAGKKTPIKMGVRRAA